MKARRVALALVAATLPMLIGARAANADDPGDCIKRNPKGFCVEWSVGGHQPTSGGGGGGNGGVAVCYWVNNPPITAPTIYADYGLSYPPPGVDIQWQYYACSDGSVPDNYRWVFSVPPTDTAANILVRIERGLEPPKV